MGSAPRPPSRFFYRGEHRRIKSESQPFLFALTWKNSDDDHFIGEAGRDLRLAVLRGQERNSLEVNPWDSENVKTVACLQSLRVNSRIGSLDKHHAAQLADHSISFCVQNGGQHEDGVLSLLHG